MMYVLVRQKSGCNKVDSLMYLFHKKKNLKQKYSTVTEASLLSMYYSTINIRSLFSWWCSPLHLLEKETAVCHQCNSWNGIQESLTLQNNIQFQAGDVKYRPASWAAASFSPSGWQLDTKMTFTAKEEFLTLSSGAGIVWVEKKYIQYRILGEIVGLSF